jgi:hypothetical protein
MSEMSRAQGQAHQDPNPTDDMVPPAAQVPDSYVESFGPRDSGAEDVGPQDVGAEDVGPQDVGAEDVGSQDFGAEDVSSPDMYESQPAGEPLPTVASGGEDSGLPAQSSSDPMPDIAGKG